MSYNPEAYGKEYNTKLLQQIVSPLKEKEEESIQEQKEAFSGSGGYGTGA